MSSPKLTLITHNISNHGNDHVDLSSTGSIAQYWSISTPLTCAHTASHVNCHCLSSMRQACTPQVQTGWPNELSIFLSFWEIEEFEPHGYVPWSSQTDNLKIDTCRFLARHSALLGTVKAWLAQCQDNVTWVGYHNSIRLRCWWPGLPMEQHYQFIMSTRCHKLVPILIWP